MDLVIASDHAGVALKASLVEWLTEEKHLDVVDLGPASSESVDYPDFAAELCGRMTDGSAERGILICNTGIGMSISANRHRGVRAALCLYPRMAYYARHHNDANVLVLGAGQTARHLAGEIVEVFLREPFDGGRHGRRTRKIDRQPGGCSD